MSYLDLKPIPFNRPTLVGGEILLIEDAVKRGHISGNGYYTHLAERLLTEISGSSNSLMTTSCTHALELSARILSLNPGDEVIVPAYTFVSTASAFALTGAKPIFVDVDSDTLNLDVDLVRQAITPQTKAICTVHYAGIAKSIDQLATLCRAEGIALIEDNAHGLGARFDGKLLGTFGQLSTLSFHETKNVTCGEGGALNINDTSMLSLAEILREKGTDRAQFLRGQIDKYTWVEMGSSWVASDILAAFLVSQLESFETIQTKRMNIWNAYDSALSEWAANWGVRTPAVPRQSEHAAHMYYLQFENLEDRTSFIEHMKKQHIMAVFHYQALNTSRVGMTFGGRIGECPVAENAADTLVRLPLFGGLLDSEIERIIDAVLEFQVA